LSEGIGSGSNQREREKIRGQKGEEEHGGSDKRQEVIPVSPFFFVFLSPERERERERE